MQIVYVDLVYKLVLFYNTLDLTESYAYAI